MKVKTETFNRTVGGHCAFSKVTLSKSGQKNTTGEESRVMFPPKLGPFSAGKFKGGAPGLGLGLGSSKKENLKNFPF
jgi:hypothetical protein